MLITFYFANRSGKLKMIIYWDSPCKLYPVWILSLQFDTEGHLSLVKEIVKGPFYTQVK